MHESSKINERRFGNSWWGVLKSWSKLQATVAMSSGEAEYYAMVKAAAEGIGVQSLMKDLGVDVSIELFTDSSAAKSMASRSGVGKVRHMEVKWLWLLEKVKAGKTKMRKVAGEVNPADVLTKPKMLRDAIELLRPVGVMFP